MNIERRPEIIKEKRVENNPDKTPFEGLFNFKPPSPENLKEISEYKEKLKDFKDPFPFRTEEREGALKIIEKSGRGKGFNEDDVIKAIGSRDPIVRDVAVEWLDELNNLSSKNIGRLEKVLEKGKWKDGWDIKEKIEKKIEQLKRGGEGAEIPAEEDKFYLEKAVEKIEKLKDDLGDLGDKPWQSLYTREEEIIKKIKNLIINIGEEGGEKAIPALKKLSQKKNRYISWPATQLLARIIIKSKGEKALEGIFKDCGEKIEAAVNFERKQMPTLLTTKERPLATGDREKLTDGLTEVKKLYQQLKENFGDKVIGIIVIHGAVGGYHTNELSDIDVAIIVKEEALKDMFDEHGSKIPSKTKGGINLHPHFVSVDEYNKVIPFDAIPYLFSGRHLETSPEDRQLLKEVQINTLKNLDERKWDAVRRMHRKEEADAVEKISLRFGINEKKTKKLSQIFYLRNIPPTLKETLEILEKNSL